MYGKQKVNGKYTNEYKILGDFCNHTDKVLWYFDTTDKRKRTYRNKSAKVDYYEPAASNPQRRFQKY